MTDLQLLTGRLDDAVERLAAAPAFSKPTRLRPVLDTARRVLLDPGGAAEIEARAGELQDAGVFLGTDWDRPEILNPTLSRHALTSPETDTVLVEVLSDLRMVAVATGKLAHPAVSAEQAREHLTRVLATNLDLLFGPPSEAERVRQGRLVTISRNTLEHVASRIGYERLLGELVDEIWRLLLQRPIQVDHIVRTITEVAAYRSDPEVDLGPGTHDVDRLITSVYGPTMLSRGDPGLDAYRAALSTADETAIRSEASGFARAMHDTGLVSPYHAVFVKERCGRDDHLLAEALGLSVLGRGTLAQYRDLVHRLVDLAVHPGTHQCLYGMARLLERGVLHHPAVPPSLWGHVRLELSPTSTDTLLAAFGPEPSPKARLLAGVISMLGQPLGVGQGDSPTCQSARALSMWATTDPDVLLWAVGRAARDDEVVLPFEGEPISSVTAAPGVATVAPIDLDPVSLLVVPHLDRIYVEMGRRCIGRPGDPHRWVNPEFHGWWSWRGFRIAVDVESGALLDLEGFVRHLYATYHPAHNGGQPLTHPQPAGLAVTDAAGRFVGWHAITLLRAGQDPQGTIRFYFFNPNNDSGQDWGDGVVVSTAGHGERFGESSLPFEELASRLYIFHFDEHEGGEPASVPADEVARVIDRVHRTWGADRHPTASLQADPGP